MAFAVDRDLLVLEPSLFRDVAWAGQTLASAADAAIAGTTLTSASSDFEAAGVDAGHVAVVGGTSLEVLERLGATTLRVSLLREGDAGPALPPAAVSGAPLVIATFGPQLRAAHEELMRSLGIEPGADPEAEPDPGVGAGAPTEASIVNPRALARAEALGAMRLILAGAAATTGEGSTLWVKSEHYRERLMAERRRVRALVDLDGDGAADATRRIDASQFVRG